MKTETLDLKTRWQELLHKVPKLRIRDAARELGVSEAELLATRCGESVTRLEGKWDELIKRFPTLGEVMCLTRNEAAVHERYGIFTEEISFFHGMGQILGPDIDLRLFMNHWEFGFAVRDETNEGPRRSLQFFDADGTAVFKLYLTKQSNVAVCDELIQSFAAANQSPVQAILPQTKTTSEERPDSDIDVEGFRKAWESTKDTHEFFVLLKKFGVARQQALRLAPPGQAWRGGIIGNSKNARGCRVPQSPDHGVCRQPGLHSDSHRACRKYQTVWRIVAQRPG